MVRVVMERVGCMGFVGHGHGHGHGNGNAGTLRIRCCIRGGVASFLLLLAASGCSAGAAGQGGSLHAAAHPVADGGHTVAEGIDAVAFLVGTWVVHDGAVTTERWSPPGGDTMLGLAQTVIGGQTVFFEYLRIEADEGGLVYIASPKDEATVRFPATTIEAGRVVFENPHHDYPTRITYERQGDNLLARIEGPGEEPKTWTYVRKD